MHLKNCTERTHGMSKRACLMVSYSTRIACCAWALVHPEAGRAAVSTKSGKCEITFTIMPGLKFTGAKQLNTSALSGNYHVKTQDPKTKRDNCQVAVTKRVYLSKLQLSLCLMSFPLAVLCSLKQWKDLFSKSRCLISAAVLIPTKQNWGYFAAKILPRCCIARHRFCLGASNFPSLHYLMGSISKCGSLLEKSFPLKIFSAYFAAD